MTNFKEDLARVKAFVFDIDGVMSLQTISLNAFGIPNRTVNLRDGYAIQLAVKKGYQVAVISGSNAKEYIKRLKLLGVKDVYLNSRSKVEHFNSFLKKHNIQKSDIREPSRYFHWPHSQCRMGSERTVTASRKTRQRHSIRECEHH